MELICIFYSTRILSLLTIHAANFQYKSQLLNPHTLVGTITSINTPNAFPAEANLTITYDEPITVAGGILGAVNQNQITVENTFILVKGRVL